MKYTLLGLVGSVGMVLLPQCAGVGQGPGVAGIDLPAAWRAAAQLPPTATDVGLARWWERFGDPTLSALVADGLRANPDLAAAWQTVVEASAQRRVARTALLPRLDGAASADRARINRAGLLDNQETIYTSRLEASWELDWFGRNRANLAAAEADQLAARELWHAAKVGLAAEISTAWWSLRVSQMRLELLEKIIATRAEASDLATWRYEAGQTDALAADQARASVEQAKAARAGLLRSQAEARHLLARLTGKSAAQSGPRGGGAALPEPSVALAARIPADLLRQRPDLREATWRCVAAVARGHSARVEAFPSLRLTGTLGTSSLGSGRVFSAEQLATDVIVGVAGPIFDAGRIRAQVDARNAAARRAFEQYRATLLRALAEVEDASVACQQNRTRVEHFTAAATSARAAADLAMQRYRSGVVDFGAVLDTQRLWLESEDALILARGDLLNAHVQLFRAVGGGW